MHQLDKDVLSLLKASNEQTVEIPLRRVIDILPKTNESPAILELSGRVQFVTMANRWRFFPESDNGDSGHGLGKMSSPGDLQAKGIYADLDKNGIQYCWDWKSNLSDRLASGWKVFYDNDGRYLRYVVSPSEQIFLTRLNSKT